MNTQNLSQPSPVVGIDYIRARVKGCRAISTSKKQASLATTIYKDTQKSPPLPPKTTEMKHPATINYKQI